MKIAILGGSGKLGHGLVLRLASHELRTGSRDPAKGIPYPEAAAWCDLAIVSAPYSVHQTLLDAIKDGLRGKIVVDATVPLDPANPTRILTATGLSAAEEAAKLIPDAQVFAAFQTISHHVLMKPDVSADVLVVGGIPGRDVVLDVIRGMNLRPVLAGPLTSAGHIERLTALLISINKANKVRESSIRIEGI